MRLPKPGGSRRPSPTRLKSAYRFLRFVEHRLQMLNDEQTQTLPDEPQGFEVLARFCGLCRSCRASRRGCANILGAVQRHYAALFEDAPELGTDTGSLVFTGGEDDPETITTLVGDGLSPAERSVSDGSRLAFWSLHRDAKCARPRTADRAHAGAAFRAWRRAGDADRLSSPSIVFLPACRPACSFSRCSRPIRDLLDLIATILGAAPRLAEQLSRRPKVLDAVLDRRFFGPLPRREEIAALAEAAIPPHTPLEEAIDRARILAHEQSFRFGVRILSETVSAGEAGGAFSALAGVYVAHSPSRGRARYRRAPWQHPGRPCSDPCDGQAWRTRDDRVFGSRPHPHLRFSGRRRSFARQAPRESRTSISRGSPKGSFRR